MMARELRRFRWVNTPDGLGIVTDMAAGRVAVDLVDENGETTESKRFPTSEVNLADLDAVPKARLNPKAVQLSEPISEEENKAKTEAILAGMYDETDAASKLVDEDRAWR
jgi:hypothetical protein